MFHLSSSIIGDDCNDSNWAIRPHINNNGLVPFNRSGGAGLTISDLTNTEYVVAKYEVLSSFLNSRRAFAKIQSTNPLIEVQTQDEDTIIKVTTDCSGLEIPLYALNAMGRKVRRLSSSDNNKAVRDSIRANHKPEKLYEDINQRKLCSEIQSDLYVAGFPCQSFSTALKRRGLKTKQTAEYLKIY